MLFSSPDANNNGVGDYCEPGAPNFNGSEALVGFAWGAIYDSDDIGGDEMLRLRINTEFSFDDFATAGGGTVDYGVDYHPPARLVVVASP